MISLSLSLSLSRLAKDSCEIIGISHRRMLNGRKIEECKSYRSINIVACFVDHITCTVKASDKRNVVNIFDKLNTVLPQSS